MRTFNAFVGLAILVSNPVLAFAEGDGVRIQPTAQQGSPAVEVSKTVQVGENTTIKATGVTNGSQADGSIVVTHTEGNTTVAGSVGTNNGQPAAEISVNVTLPP